MPQVASDIDLVLRLGILALGAFRLRQILRLEIAERVDASDEGLRSPYVAAFFAWTSQVDAPFAARP